ncbi:MAG: hypothetical protein MZV70_56610 [Desulfobacterales bacterium]|nr:hypothetical protein [Desulfobacterales bacterium]
MLAQAHDRRVPGVGALGAHFGGRHPLAPGTFAATDADHAVTPLAVEGSATRPPGSRSPAASPWPASGMPSGVQPRRL